MMRGIVDSVAPAAKPIRRRAPKWESNEVPDMAAQIHPAHSKTAEIKKDGRLRKSNGE